MLKAPVFKVKSPSVAQEYPGKLHRFETILESTQVLFVVHSSEVKLQFLGRKEEGNVPSENSVLEGPWWDLTQDLFRSLTHQRTQGGSWLPCPGLQGLHGALEGATDLNIFLLHIP